MPIPMSLRREAPIKEADTFPDVRRIAKAHGRNLFPHRPSHVEISTAIYNSAQRSYSICARDPAQPAYPMMIARIDRETLVDRRRATADDGCSGQQLEDMDVD